MNYVGVLGVIVLLFILLDTVINKMYQNKKRIHHVTPEKFNIPFEEIHIPVGEEGQLYGWWMPSSPNAPTLILVHGWGRNLARMIHYIHELHPEGYNLLAFDARNHGSSTPEAHPTVWTFAEDICAVGKFITENNLTSSPEIGVIGLSIGGGAAINAATLDHHIQSVVTVGALSHPIDVMKLEFQKKHIPFYPLVWGFLKYIGFRFKINFNKIVSDQKESHSPFIITQNGKSAGIILDIETWEQISRKIELLKLINEGEESIRQTVSIPIKKVKAMIKVDIVSL